MTSILTIQTGAEILLENYLRVQQIVVDLSAKHAVAGRELMASFDTTVKRRMDAQIAYNLVDAELCIAGKILHGMRLQ